MIEQIFIIGEIILIIGFFKFFINWMDERSKRKRLEHKLEEGILIEYIDRWGLINFTQIQRQMNRRMKELKRDNDEKKICTVLRN